MERDDYVEYLMKKSEQLGISFLSEKEAVDLFLWFACSCSCDSSVFSIVTNDKPYAIFEASETTLRNKGLDEPAAFLVSKFKEISSRCVNNNALSALTAKKQTAEEQRQQLEDLIIQKFVGVYNERVLLILFSRNGKLAYFDFITTGSNTNVQLNVTEICRLASLTSSKTAVIAHNHPSGSYCPSSDDYTATLELSRALKKTGISLHDHYIVTRTMCTSMRKIFDFNSEDQEYINTTLIRLSHMTTYQPGWRH